MPTAAKLAAALLFAALCWCVGEAIVRFCLEDGIRVGAFREMLAAGGLVIGWRMIGKAATGPVGRGNSIPNVITSGIAAAFVFAVLALLLHSFGEMIVESLDSRYSSIGRAATAWMAFLVRDVQTIWHPYVLGLLFGGGAVTGLLAGVVGRRIS